MPSITRAASAGGWTSDDRCSQCPGRPRPTSAARETDSPDDFSHLLDMLRHLAGRWRSVAAQTMSFSSAHDDVFLVYRDILYRGVPSVSRAVVAVGTCDRSETCVRLSVVRVLGVGADGTHRGSTACDGRRPCADGRAGQRNPALSAGRTKHSTRRSSEAIGQLDMRE
jgi:hypothetical protein